MSRLAKSAHLITDLSGIQKALTKKIVLPYSPLGPHSADLVQLLILCVEQARQAPAPTQSNARQTSIPSHSGPSSSRTSPPPDIGQEIDSWLDQVNMDLMRHLTPEPNTEAQKKKEAARLRKNQLAQIRYWKAKGLDPPGTGVQTRLSPSPVFTPGTFSQDSSPAVGSDSTGALRLTVTNAPSPPVRGDSATPMHPPPRPESQKRKQARPDARLSKQRKKVLDIPGTSVFQI